MTLEHYDFISGSSSFSYDFVSIGPRGHIRKAIQFTLLYDDDIYNLAFGDFNPVTGEIDDFATSDNKDTDKVLATVVAIVYSFFEKFPEVWVYATGSTGARTRLYGMGINRYFDIAKEDFHILAEKDGAWDVYKKGISYDAFLVRKKM